MNIFKYRRFKLFAQDDSGVTAIEYGLIAGAMATCLILVMPLLTNGIKNSYTAIGGRFK